MKKDKNKIEEHDKKASLSAAILRMAISISLVGVFIVLIINTINIFSVPYQYNQAVKNKTVEKYLKDQLNEESLLVENGQYSEEKIDKIISSTNSKVVYIHIMYETIALEICLILLLIAGLYLLNFLSVKNLQNPFTNESIKYLKQTINFRIATFIISIVAVIIESAVFIDTNLDTATLLGDTGNLSSLLIIIVLYISKYILETAKKKIEEK